MLNLMGKKINTILPGLQIRVHIGKLFSLFLIQNICCGYSKEQSQWDGSFEHPKCMLKLMGKKISTNLVFYSKKFVYLISKPV